MEGGVLNYSAGFLALNASYQAEGQASVALLALLTLSRHPLMDIQPQPHERFNRARLPRVPLLSNATDA
jgi:hypothetical protein